MKMAFYVALILVFSNSSWSQDRNCVAPKDALVEDFCRVGYFTLSKLQAMQIQQKISPDLDISAMEMALNTKAFYPTSTEGWTGLNTKEKSNRIFKNLLMNTGQWEKYRDKQLPELNHKMPQMRLESTGTRGGGLGNETYILPDGFWID